MKMKVVNFILHRKSADKTSVIACGGDISVTAAILIWGGLLKYLISPLLGILPKEVLVPTKGDERKNLQQIDLHRGRSSTKVSRNRSGC